MGQVYEMSDIYTLHQPGRTRRQRRGLAEMWMRGGWRNQEGGDKRKLLWFCLPSVLAPPTTLSMTQGLPDTERERLLGILDPEP